MSSSSYKLSKTKSSVQNGVVSISRIDLSEKHDEETYDSNNVSTLLHLKPSHTSEQCYLDRGSLRNGYAVQKSSNGRSPETSAPELMQKMGPLSKYGIAGVTDLVRDRTAFRVVRSGSRVAGKLSDPGISASETLDKEVVLRRIRQRKRVDKLRTALQSLLTSPVLPSAHEKKKWVDDAFAAH